MPQETLRYVDEMALSGELDLFLSTFKAAGDNAEGDVIAELGGILNNPKAKAYVDALGSKLVKGSNRTDKTYTFDVIKNKQMNAFALPNGSVYVTDGLLRMLRNEAQLANVIGHEVGHIDRDHGIKQFGMDLFGKAAGALARVIAGGDKEAKRAAKKMANDIISNGYSQDLELQADEIGQKFAYMAGWDPNGMIDIMSIFLSLEKDPHPPSGIFDYTRSHPHAETRLNQAVTRMAAYPAKKPTGEAEYKAFLKDAFGLSDSELKLDPKQAAYSVSAVSVMTDVVVPGIAIGGVAILILLAIYLYTRK